MGGASEIYWHESWRLLSFPKVSRGLGLSMFQDAFFCLVHSRARFSVGRSEQRARVIRLFLWAVRSLELKWAPTERQ